MQTRILLFGLLQLAVASTSIASNNNKGFPKMILNNDNFSCTIEEEKVSLLIAFDFDSEEQKFNFKTELSVIYFSVTKEEQLLFQLPLDSKNVEVATNTFEPGIYKLELLLSDGNLLPIDIQVKEKGF